jgi:hypothetical protein
MKRKHTCDVDGCGKAFPYISRLVTHTRTHTGEKPFPCDADGCDKAFATRRNLVCHVRTHTGEKPFTCDVDGCDKAFTKSCQLSRHTKTHTGEKPFTCDVDGCGNAFAVNDDLRVHKRTHTGEKPYKCTHCVATFTSRSSFRKHVSNHEVSYAYAYICKYEDHGENEYKPDEKSGALPCPIRCKRAYDLDVHIQQNHTQEGLHKRIKSESSMAAWFESEGYAFTRDWENYVNHHTCADLRVLFPGKFSRPDFRLYILETILRAILLVGNDEFCHRRTACEFTRMVKIMSALDRTEETRNLPLVYIRFNPHWYTKDGVKYDPDLSTRYKALARLLRRLPSMKLEPGLHIMYLFYDQCTPTSDAHTPAWLKGFPLAKSLCVFRECKAINIDGAKLLASRVKYVG